MGGKLGLDLEESCHHKCSINRTRWENDMAKSCVGQDGDVRDSSRGTVGRICHSGHRRESWIKGTIPQNRLYSQSPVVLGLLNPAIILLSSSSVMLLSWLPSWTWLP